MEKFRTEVELLILLSGKIRNCSMTFFSYFKKARTEVEVFLFFGKFRAEVLLFILLWKKQNRGVTFFSSLKIIQN